MNLKGWSVRLERREPPPESEGLGMSAAWLRLVPRLAVVRQEDDMMNAEEVIARVRQHMAALRDAPVRSKKPW